MVSGHNRFSVGEQNRNAKCEVSTTASERRVWDRMLRLLVVTERWERRWSRFNGSAQAEV